jgi:hypothetical protein
MPDRLFYLNMTLFIFDFSAVTYLLKYSMDSMYK